MKFRSLLSVFACSFSVLLGQPDMSYYFPDHPDFDPSIPKPAEALGFQVGEKHVSHDQLVKYMYLLAESSSRIAVERYGWTYEHRPLILLTISSPGNLSNIEQIRNEHLKLSDPEQSDNLSIVEMPAVIWLGYSVHGNEPSGLNASLLVAYYLAACTSPELTELLDNTIILLDPSINPDGYSRFEQWVNQYKSQVSITDPNNIEHNEAWPGGRTNHYWFDLNRDLLPLQHPESKARIAQYYKWRPNIFTDHHEMGSNSTFFFQPGIPSRNNPNTPVRNTELTAKIAEYHAAALDKIGSLYYSKEVFDDFYYGKGSSYPDVNGSIGILFEQASSRGHARQTENGILEFPFTIRNQLTVSLSSLKAGVELKDELLKYQVDFYKNSLDEARKDTGRAYVIDGGNDNTKTRHFLDVLLQHQIEVYRLNDQLSLDDHTYSQGNSYVVPLQQYQYRLIKALFEKSTSFSDSLFYDISAWTFPLAFDMDFAMLNNRTFHPGIMGEKIGAPSFGGGTINARSDYAYLMRWDDSNAPKALNMLFRNNLKVKLAMKSFVTEDGASFSPGTVLIPLHIQDITGDEMYDILKNIAATCRVDFQGTSTGFNIQGIDLGSPNISSLEKPKIMLLIGQGISSYEAGEVWHLLDYRYDIPVSLIDIDRFNRMNLNQYNTLILVSGDYSGISENAVQKLSAWIRNGNQIVAIKGGAKWLIDQKMANIRLKSAKIDTISQKSYGEMESYIGAQSIGGAIFKTKLDLTHPLCFGYPDVELSIFKNGKLFFEKSANPYNNPVIYTDDPLLSGYISDPNYDMIRNSSALIVSSVGNGKTICFSDDPNFRAFWYGTNRLFLNAIFFGSLINSSSAR